MHKAGCFTELVHASCAVANSLGLRDSDVSLVWNFGIVCECFKIQVPSFWTKFPSFKKNILVQKHSPSSAMSLADELLADLEDLEDDDEDVDVDDVGGPADDHEKDVATVIGDASISR